MYIWTLAFCSRHFFLFKWKTSPGDDLGGVSSTPKGQDGSRSCRDSNDYVESCIGPRWNLKGSDDGPDKFLMDYGMAGALPLEGQAGRRFDTTHISCPSLLTDGFAQIQRKAKTDN